MGKSWPSWKLCSARRVEITGDGMRKVPLEECCEILDSQRIPITASDRKKGQYPYYGANGIQDFVDDYIFDDELVLLAEDGGNFGSKGRPIAYRVSGKCWVNNHAHVLKPKHGLDVDYLCYALMFYDVTGLVNGATRMKLTQAAMRQMLIPMPEISEQHKTVHLLSSVQEIMRKRQQQLSALDDLIKARFVEMFGDPVSNPKGWEKAALNNNATLLNGRAYKQEELLDTGKYPVLRVGNFFSNRGWYYSDLELEEDKYCDNGDLLYAWSASFGSQIWTGGRVIYHYHIWKVIVGDAYNKQFLCKLLDYATDSLMGDTHGIAMMHLTKSGMEQTEFIVPPLSLQEQFAAFVSQIDKSKSVIQKSLDETQLLFDSLMQKYFG